MKKNAQFLKILIRLDSHCSMRLCFIHKFHQFVFTTAIRKTVLIFIFFLFTMCFGRLLLEVHYCSPIELIVGTDFDLQIDHLLYKLFCKLHPSDQLLFPFLRRENPVSYERQLVYWCFVDSLHSLYCNSTWLDTCFFFFYVIKGIFCGLIDWNF